MTWRIGYSSTEDELQRDLSMNIVEGLMLNIRGSVIVSELLSCRHKS